MKGKFYMAGNRFLQKRMKQRCKLPPRSLTTTRSLTFPRKAGYFFRNKHHIIFAVKRWRLRRGTRFSFFISPCYGNSINPRWISILMFYRRNEILKIKIWDVKDLSFSKNKYNLNILSTLIREISSVPLNEKQNWQLRRINWVSSNEICLIGKC